MTVFRRVTLPVLVPAIVAGALLAVLYALSDFGAVSLLQFDSLSRAIYLQYGASFDRSLAAILALVLVVITFVLTWGETRLRSRAGAYATRARRPPDDRRARALAVAGHRLPRRRRRPGAHRAGRDRRVVAGSWPRPGRAIAARGRTWRSIRSSSAGSRRWPRSAWRWWSRCCPPATDRASRRSSARRVFAGYALPGIVVALAMVFLATRTLPFAYQTLGLLVVVYAVRFMPQAVGGLRAGLGQAGRGIEEAGRTLGDGPVRAFVRLTLPALRPAFVAARRPRVPDGHQGAAAGPAAGTDRVRHARDRDLGRGVVRVLRAGGRSRGAAAGDLGRDRRGAAARRGTRSMSGSFGGHGAAGATAARPAFAVQARGLRRRFGDVLAVDDVDLEVLPGEMLTVLGPSGCGKTTVLRLIAGLDTPDAGHHRDRWAAGVRCRRIGPARATAGRDGLPGRRALPAPVRARQHRLRAAARPGPRGPGPRAARAHRPARCRRPDAVPAVGRDAAAGRGGPCPGAAAGRRAARRAVLVPGRRPPDAAARATFARSCAPPAPPRCS